MAVVFLPFFSCLIIIPFSCLFTSCNLSLWFWQRFQHCPTTGSSERIHNGGKLSWHKEFFRTLPWKYHDNYTVSDLGGRIILLRNKDYSFFSICLKVRDVKRPSFVFQIDITWFSFYRKLISRFSFAIVFHSKRIYSRPWQYNWMHVFCVIILIFRFQIDTNVFIFVSWICFSFLFVLKYPCF